MDQTWSNWISDEIIIEIYHQIFNFIYFLIRLNQICPKYIKMDQTWSNWISEEMIIEIYHLIFSSRPSENLLKCFSRFCNLFSQIFHFFHIFNFWWNNHWNISSDFHFFIRLNQICPKLIKMDQTWSNLISDEIIIEIYHQIFNFIHFLIRLNQICPKWIKMDQTWSNWISDEIIIEIYHQIFNFIYFLIRLNQICPKWIKLDQIGFLMK